MTSDSHGRGNTLQYKTASTTIEIAAGRVVELDSSGDVVLATATPGNPVGVTADKVSSRTTASKEDIVVQTTGLVNMACAANEAFGYNDQVISATADGKAATAATFAGTTFGSEDARKVIGRVYEPDATTLGTDVIVSLNIK